MVLNSFDFITATSTSDSECMLVYDCVSKRENQTMSMRNLGLEFLRFCELERGRGRGRQREQRESGFLLCEGADCKKRAERECEDSEKDTQPHCSCLAFVGGGPRFAHDVFLVAFSLWGAVSSFEQIESDVMLLSVHLQQRVQPRCSSVSDCRARLTGLSLISA